MVPGLLGKKLEMTQIFAENGDKIPVTVVEAGPCVIQAVKDEEKDGYYAVQLGFDDTKETRIKKPQREYLRKNKLQPKKFVCEIRCEEKLGVKVGDEVTVEIFQKGDMLDVTGISKGKGFQGGMKRCGWAGGGDTHGSMSHRAPGSIGASTFPSRVTKGHGMPGQMGNKKSTVQNLEVMDVNKENHTVIVKGALPGANGGYLVIRYAKKRPISPRVKAEVKDNDKAENKEESKE